jgi:hypothetical protein
MAEDLDPRWRRRPTTDRPGRAGMSGRGRLRASDADREQIVERLRGANDDGRLSGAEFDERVGRALRARTYAQLDAIVADLPQGSKPSRRSRRTALVHRRRRVLVAALSAAAVAVPLTGAVPLIASGGWLPGGGSSHCWWYTNPKSAIGKSPAQLVGMCPKDQPPGGRPRADTLR